MPIYEYQCQNCGNIRELMQKIGDPAPEGCASCSSGPMVKMMSRTAFVLKGEGWYVTDFRDGGKKTESKSESSSTPKATSEATGTPSTDSGTSASKSEGDKPKAAEASKPASSSEASSSSGS